MFVWDWRRGVLGCLGCGLGGAVLRIATARVEQVTWYNLRGKWLTVDALSAGIEKQGTIDECEAFLRDVPVSVVDYHLRVRQRLRFPKGRKEAIERIHATKLIRTAVSVSLDKEHRSAEDSRAVERALAAMLMDALRESGFRVADSGSPAMLVLSYKEYVSREPVALEPRLASEPVRQVDPTTGLQRSTGLSALGLSFTTVYVPREAASFALALRHEELGELSSAVVEKSRISHRRVPAGTPEWLRANLP